MRLCRIMFLFAASLNVFACAENTALLPGAFILPVDSGKKLLEQCSRDVPQNITGFWSPSIQEIDSVDRNIGGYLDIRKSKGAHKKPRWDINRYHRQYLGIIQGGKHLIYGSYYRIDPNHPEDFKGEDSEPTIICDGGPDIFGIVYDPALPGFVDIQFNGPFWEPPNAP